MLVLDSVFFNRAAVRVARELIGKVLVRKIGKREVALVINETEAYDGFEDKASHAHRGMTERNKIMFGRAGRFYVYLIYGAHYMLNIVTGADNYPAAVLIRGGFTLDGENINGPGKLTKYLRIGKNLNGLEASKKSNLWFEDKGIKISRSQIQAGRRVGVDYAGEWKNRLYNFKMVL